MSRSLPFSVFLLFLACPLLLPEYAATTLLAQHAANTYFVSPADRASGSSRLSGEAFRAFDAAISRLQPGDTLVIRNGTYPVADTAAAFHADCGENAASGTADARITVRAENERRVWLKGEGTVAPFRLSGCSYWDVEGLRASSEDVSDGAPDIFVVVNSDHIRMHRLLAHDVNRFENSSGIQITRSHHILVEEGEVYDFHRHGISTYQSGHVTIRRAFVHARGARDVEGGWGSHGCCTRGGDEGFSFYFTSNSILENSISSQSEALSVISGVETVLGNPGGQHNRVLGSISLHDLRPGFVQSRKFKNPDRPYTGPVTDVLYKDYLVVGGQDIDEGSTFALTVAHDLTIDGATWIDTRHTPVYANPETRELRTRYFLGCDRDEVGGCKYDVRNALFIDNTFHRATLLYAPPKNGLDWRMAHANAWDASGRGFGSVGEDVGDGIGRYQHATSVRPTRMGLAEGECIVFVPEGSNMSDAGKGGADIGANILYRYENSRLTERPLWDPVTGAFPHGAIVDGVNDVPGASAFDVHERLNVNTNGCRLPYSR